MVSFTVVLCFIFGIFWGLKRQSWITIPQMDLAMDPDYAPGMYHIGPRPATQAEMLIGKAYVYFLPESPVREKRVAWLVAKEGQQIEFKEKGLYVDGAKTDCKISLPRLLFAPFMVPRGSVYLVSVTPEKDSLSCGPIPFRNVLGQL